jgi:hypothetical protein
MITADTQPVGKADTYMLFLYPQMNYIKVSYFI